MEARKFKPGDWVAVRGDWNSPLMQVINYNDAAPQNKFGLGSNLVRCVFYRNGTRLEKTFHQSRLVKSRIGKSLPGVATIKQLHNRL